MSQLNSSFAEKVFPKHKSTLHYYVLYKSLYSVDGAIHLTSEYNLHNIMDTRAGCRRRPTPMDSLAVARVCAPRGGTNVDHYDGREGTDRYGVLCERINFGPVTKLSSRISPLIYRRTKPRTVCQPVTSH